MLGEGEVVPAGMVKMLGSTSDADPAASTNLTCDRDALNKDQIEFHMRLLAPEVSAKPPQSEQTDLDARARRSNCV